MNIREYRFLLSERATLEKMLDEISPKSVIGRMSLEQRKEEVEERIAAFEREPAREIDAQLKFRGGPVTALHGIEAGFAADAIKAFTDAVAAVGAGYDSALGARGALPNRSAYEMVITNTFPGSFGFQVEAAPRQDALAEDSDALESAIGQFKSILKASADADEPLSEAVAGTDARAINSVREFLEVMAKRDAFCALGFKGEEFRFHDPAEVRRSASRLNPNNIKEFDSEMTVRFQGALPEARRVEFTIEGANEPVSGRVAGSTEDVSAINKFLYEPMAVNARVRQVGTSKPVYTILKWEPAAPLR